MREKYAKSSSASCSETNPREMKSSSSMVTLGVPTKLLRKLRSLVTS